MTAPLPVDVERLYTLGVRIHWLRARDPITKQKGCKIPIDGGWNSRPPDSLERLRETYKPGYGSGARLGAVSKIGDHYLAVLDLDIKSAEPRHRKEAEEAFFNLYPECRGGPHILSGRGNGSAHYYVRVPDPDCSVPWICGSDEKVKIHAPSSKSTDVDRKGLTAEEIKSGLRIKGAWEISLLANGRQAALAGTLHPDTKKRYVWGKELGGAADLPLLVAKRQGATKKALAGPLPAKVYTFTEVDAHAVGLSKKYLAALLHGEGVEKRHRMVLSICMSLLSKGVLSKEQIVSLFTDRRYFLGQMGFDKARTDDRQKAASWVDRYCLKRAEEKLNASPFDIEELDESKPRRTPTPLPKGFSGEVGGWEDGLDRSYGKDGTPGKIKNTYENLALIFANCCKGHPDIVQKDLFNLKYQYTCETPWGCKKGQERSSGLEDALLAKKWLSEKYGIAVSTSAIDEMINTTAETNRTHPVKAYLEALVWDGEERIETAFRRYLGADMPEPYLTEVSRKFFSACVTRIYRPGCKFDYVIVLEGKQGLGKSTFCNSLVGDDWFLEGLPNFHDKDAALNLQGAWICELGEMAALNRSGNEMAKTFIARRIDKLRPPYGRTRIDFARSTIFIGSTDKRDYLTDTAGNRRYWPIHVKQCDFEALARDRDQLWAEAILNRRHRPEPLYLTGEAKEQAEEIQESRRIEDEGDGMDLRLKRWVAEQRRENREFKKLHMEDLFKEGPFVSFKDDVPNRRRAGEILRIAGYDKKKVGNNWIWFAER